MNVIRMVGDITAGTVLGKGRKEGKLYMELGMEPKGSKEL